MCPKLNDFTYFSNRRKKNTSLQLIVKKSLGEATILSTL